jgi:negative regulator of flagellin synthesis FlgM
MIDRLSPSRVGTPSVADARAPRAISASVAAAPSTTEATPSLASEPRRIAAEGPPIDAARVERLRGAIADGSFVVDAQRIATAMIAAEQNR